MIELITDIVGTNKKGKKCHPYKQVKGQKKGYFSFTFQNDNRSFKPISESELRDKIEKGEFNEKGRVRMLPHGATNTLEQGAFRVRSYKGKYLPV